jgi:hypothetical protein
MKINEFAGETIHRWIIHVVSFPVICGKSLSSSRLRRYGLVKLENPHELSRSPRRSKKSNYSRSS